MPLDRTGVRVSPFTRAFSFTSSMAVNYMMLFRRTTETAGLMKIALFGATGGTGRQVLSLGLAQWLCHFSALARSPGALEQARGS